MNVQASFIDLSALPKDPWHNRLRAVRDIHRAIDPHHMVRQFIEEAMAPPRIEVLKVGADLLLLVATEA